MKKLIATLVAFTFVVGLGFAGFAAPTTHNNKVTSVKASKATTAKATSTTARKPKAKKNKKK